MQALHSENPAGARQRPVRLRPYISWIVVAVSLNVWAALDN
ncbi:hypothetical protein V3C33_03400 [Micrococcaceae bacterium Sec5.7]